MTRMRRVVLSFGLAVFPGAALIVACTDAGPGNMFVGGACDEFSIASDPQCVCCSNRSDRCVVDVSPCAPGGTGNACGDPCPAGMECSSASGVSSGSVCRTAQKPAQPEKPSPPDSPGPSSGSSGTGKPKVPYVCSPGTTQCYSSYYVQTCDYGGQWGTSVACEKGQTCSGGRCTGGTVVDAPPVAGFTWSANGLTASFTDASSDADGTVAYYSWSFGEGGTFSTQRNPTYRYAASGSYVVTLVVTDNQGATASSSRSLTVTAATSTNLLSNGVPVTSLSGALADDLLYMFVVPANATNLTFETWGGTGDVDLYVRAGGPPSVSLYDGYSAANSNNEVVVISTPRAATYQVMLHGFKAFAGTTLTATYTP